MLFQTFCKEKTKWDDELKGDALKLYSKLLLEMEKLSGITLPRYYFLAINIVNLHLHGFSEPSCIYEDRVRKWGYCVFSCSQVQGFSNQTTKNSLFGIAGCQLSQFHPILMKMGC